MQTVGGRLMQISWGRLTSLNLLLAWTHRLSCLFLVIRCICLTSWLVNLIIYHHDSMQNTSSMVRNFWNWSWGFGRIPQPQKRWSFHYRPFVGNIRPRHFVLYNPLGKPWEIQSSWRSSELSIKCPHNERISYCTSYYRWNYLRVLQCHSVHRLRRIELEAVVE